MRVSGLVEYCRAHKSLLGGSGDLFIFGTYKYHNPN